MLIRVRQRDEYHVCSAIMSTYCSVLEDCTIPTTIYHRWSRHRHLCWHSTINWKRLCFNPHSTDVIVECPWTELAVKSAHATLLNVECHCNLCIVNTVTTTPVNGLFSRTTWVSRYQKGKTSLDLNEARDVGVFGCTGISCTIWKQYAHRFRQITTPTPHHSIFTGRMLFLTPNQQCQSTEGNNSNSNPFLKHVCALHMASHDLLSCR